jgi:hypothetical protein
VPFYRRPECRLKLGVNIRRVDFSFVFMLLAAQVNQGKRFVNYILALMQACLTSGENRLRTGWRKRRSLE